MSLLTLLLALTTAHADRYVSPLGSDLDDCLTLATPCATITQAASSATSGETIVIGAGIYSSTAASYPIQIPDGVSLQGAGADQTFVSNQQNTQFYWEGVADPSTVSDMTLTAPGNIAVWMSSGVSLEVTNVNFDHVGEAVGFAPSGDGTLTISGGQWTDVDSGMSLLGGTSADITIDGTTMSGSGSSLLYVFVDGDVDLSIENVDAPNLAAIGYVESWGQLDMVIRNSTISTTGELVVIGSASTGSQSVVLDDVTVGTGASNHQLWLSPRGTVTYDGVNAPNLELAPLTDVSLTVVDSELGGQVGIETFLDHHADSLIIRDSTIHGALAIGMNSSGTYDIELQNVDVMGGLTMTPLGECSWLMTLDEVMLDGPIQAPTIDATAAELRIVNSEFTGGLDMTGSRTSALDVLLRDVVVRNGFLSELEGDTIDLEADGVAFLNEDLPPTESWALGLVADGHIHAHLSASEFTDPVGSGLHARGTAEFDVHVEDSVLYDGGLALAGFGQPAGTLSGARNAFSGNLADVGNTSFSLAVDLGPTWFGTDDPALVGDYIYDQADDPQYSAVAYELLSHTLQPVARTTLQGHDGGRIHISIEAGSPPFVARSGTRHIEVLVGSTPLTEVVVTSDGSALVGTLSATAPGTYDLTVTNPGGHSGTQTGAVTIVQGLAAQLHLETPTFVLGESATVSVDHAQPNGMVFLAIANQGVGTPVCPPSFNGACSALPFDPALVLRSRANASGLATFTIQTPAVAPTPWGVVAQAFQFGASPTSSAAVVSGWLEPSDDTDGDGLDNLGELQAGTDPISRDTDRDGCADGEDLAPLTPSARDRALRVDCELP